MDLGYRDRVALVTGSSSGIGRAIALQLAAEGATVAVTYRADRVGAERVADEIRTAGGDVVVARFDLAEPETTHALVQQLISDHGRLDLLVANAVAWPRGSTAQPMDWRTSLRTNLEGTIATIDTALPHLLAVQGRIVLISTTVATDGMPGATTYAAAKAGLHGLTATLNVEHAPSGVLTNAVLPGLTLTDHARRLIPQAARDDVATRTPTRRLTDPRDIAHAVAFLGSPANQQITGQLLRVDGGL
jgi:NAD(P)-dependent dehydrogenase (short-subunit alcohol dehydrogenase family)